MINRRNKQMIETLTINKENMKLIETLVMYADDDLGFFRNLIDYLYRLGHNIEDRENEKEYQESLHRICELLVV